MQAVLYTHQLEPITCIDVPMWLWERLKLGQMVSFAVQEPPRLVESRIDIANRRVDIRAELLRFRGHETLMLFTADEESALLLKADFLPGQRRTQQDREMGAYADGLLAAFGLTGKGA